MNISTVLIIILCLIGNAASAQEEPQGTLRLSMKQAMAKAKEVSVSVIVSQARVVEAMAQLGQARSALLPHLSADMAGGRQTRDLRSTGFPISSVDPQIGPFNSFDARGRITQTIFDLGAFERLRSVRMKEQLSVSEMRKAKQDALALVATMFIQAQRAQEHLSLLRSSLKRDKKSLQLSRARLSQGTGSKIEEQKAFSDYKQSVYMLRSAMAEANSKRMDIAAALKLPLDRPIIFEDDEMVVKTLPEQTKNSSPDLKVAKDRLIASKANASAAHADYLPKFSLMGDYGRTGQDFDNSSNTYTVGIQASVPIWEGGNKQAKFAEAKAQVRQAQAVLDDTRLQNESDIIAMREQIASAETLLSAKNAQLALADEQLKLVLDRVRLGLAHALDADRAVAEFESMKDERFEAKALLIISKINLAHALGRMEDL